MTTHNEDVREENQTKGIEEEGEAENKNMKNAPNNT